MSSPSGWTLCRRLLPRICWCPTHSHSATPLPPWASYCRLCSIYLGGTDASTPRSKVRARQPSDAGDVGGEEVDAVTVEVAAGAVVMFGGPGVGVAGQDL